MKTYRQIILDKDEVELALSLFLKQEYRLDYADKNEDWTPVIRDWETITSKTSGCKEICFQIEE